MNQILHRGLLRTGGQQSKFNAATAVELQGFDLAVGSDKPGTNQYKVPRLVMIPADEQVIAVTQLLDRAQ